MKKESLLSLVVVFCLFLNGFGQTDSAFTNKYCKNEISINSLPFLLALGNGYMKTTQHNLVYKRVNRIGAWRLSANQVFEQPYKNYYKSGFDNLSFEENYLILSSTDTTQLRRLTVVTPIKRTHFGIGLEKRLINKKIKPFFGAELLFGFYNTSTTKWDVNYVKDTSITCFSCNEWRPDYGEPSISYEKKYSVTYIGLKPFVGLYFPLMHERLRISVQMSADVFYDIARITENDYENSFFTSYTSNILNIRSYGFLNDVSLIFRF